MKKIILLLLLNLTFMNAYTLILKDNSVVKGELIKVNDNYTQLVINGKETIVLNSLIKKRFFTPEEKAVTEKNKQLITTEIKVSTPNKQIINENETFGIKKVTKTDTHTSINMPKTSKINLYINLDIANYLNGSHSSVTGRSFQSSNKQDMVFGLGGEYNDVLFGETRYTLGALVQLERSFVDGKYSGNNFYARVEHPFDKNKKNNYLGFELNLFNANISGLSLPFTNISSTPKMGFAVYERSYFDKGFVEMGIRKVNIIMNWIDSVYIDTWKTDFESTGLYFLAGMSF